MEEIIQTLLSKLEQSPNVPLENLIREISVEMYLTPEDMTEITEVFSTLDLIHTNAVDLAKKKENGMTRIGWIEERLSNISTSSESNQEIVISQIVDGVQSGMNNTISQEV